MFNRIIRKSVPVFGRCRSSNRNNFITQTSLQLDPLLVSSHTRYVSSSCSLLYNKQNPKEKSNFLDNENGSLESDKIINETNSKQKAKNEQNVVHSEKQQTLESDKLKNDTEDSAPQKEHEKSEKTSNEANAESQEEQWDTEDSDRRYKKENVAGGDLITYHFADARKKEKNTFLECLRMYKSQTGRKSERVQFIYSALKYLKEFGVEKDLEVYKALIDIFPKHKMVPTNQFQAAFMYYPKEQRCAASVLATMEDNSVFADVEMYELLVSIFGKHAEPVRRFQAMVYWMPKFKHLNPWPVPKPIPDDAFELAKLAMIKISSIDILSEVSEYDTNDVEDSIDKTWIVSAMAPKQSELLLKHNKTKAIYVEGPFKIYVATKCVDYFTLRTDPDLTKEFPIPDLDAVDKIFNPYLETKPKAVIVLPSVHEQHDSTIFANCATGTSSKDSLLSWIRLLQVKNPIIGEIPVVFRLTNYSKEKLYIECGAETPLPIADEEMKPEETEKQMKVLKDK